MPPEAALPEASLIAGLPPPVRLALAYAPARARAPWLVLLALDARLANLVSRAREPLLAQLRLAWWRERLAEPLDAHPRGEPLLGLLAGWQGHHAGLTALVDGWEELLCGESDACAGFAEGRARACATLAGAFGVEDSAPHHVARMGRNWGIGDLAGPLAAWAEPETVRGLVAVQDWHGARLARCWRPLVVLHGLARREARGRAVAGLPSFAASVRLGLLGF